MGSGPDARELTNAALDSVTTISEHEVRAVQVKRVG